MSNFAETIAPGEPAHGIHVVSLNSSKDTADTLHTHHLGQVYCLSKGIALIRGESGVLLVHPGPVGWIPPQIPHGTYEHTSNAGWAAYITPELCAKLPENPATLLCSAFVPLIMQRIYEWQTANAITDTERLKPEQERMFQVLMDELAIATPAPGLLPSPTDARLVKIANELMDNPGDSRSLSEWGKHVGMSERGISRHFVQETGFTFAQWRRLARLLKAQKMLARGSSVQEAAWDMGYESASAFISAFREAFGLTPAKFRDTSNGGIENGLGNIR